MRLLLAATLALVASACSAESPTDSLSRATLVPGTALGPVELGKTTLREFVDTYGPGHCALFAGDDFCAIELNYEFQQLSFLWEIDAQQAYALNDPPITHATRGIDKFLAAHPQFGTATLDSLSVQAKSEPSRTFYHGGIDGNARLFAPLDSVMGYFQDPVQDAPDLVAGNREDNPPLRWTCASIGLTVYLATPEEGGAPHIARMTIFQPGPRP